MSQAQPSQRSGASSAISTRVLTVPNLLSVLRLLGVPLFAYLVLGPHADLWALLVLVLAGASDYLDGKLARAWGQESQLGRLLDPGADRLYILATVVTFVIRGVIPWWLAVVLIGRDVVMAADLLVLRRLGYQALQVHYLGKAATFNLLYAFPLLLLGVREDIVGTIARPVGWAFALWGSALYLWAAALYLIQTARLARSSAVRA